MSEYCEMCVTGIDPVWGKVCPREFVDIRGDKRWRHSHYRDRMFYSTCKNQLSESGKPEVKAVK